MKTRINLYLPHLRPVKETLSLKQSVSFMISSFLVVVLLGFGLGYMNDSLKSANVNLKQELSAQQGILTKRANELAAVTVNTPLLKDIELVREKIIDKKKVLAVLKTQFKDNVGFSPIFDGLASVQMNNTWLTRITSKEGLLNFGGRALHSQDIPRWVNALELSSAFSGLQFSNLSIRRQEGILHFTLSNSPEFLIEDEQ